MTQLSDPASSRAVLIGAHTYTALGALPAVGRNLVGLREALADKAIWGLPEANCTVLAQPETARAVFDQIRDSARAATDTLIVYYAGHGLPDPATDELRLALPDSNPAHAYTALRFEEIRQVLLDPGVPAQRKVVILDCCYSGRALQGWMSDDERTADLANQAVVDGSYLLTASAETRKALSPPGETYTAFTGALIDTLSHGIPGATDLLDMDTIYRHLYRVLNAASRPLPQQRNRNSGGLITVVRNRFTDATPTAERADAPPMSKPTAAASPTMTSRPSGAPAMRNTASAVTVPDRTATAESTSLDEPVPSQLPAAGKSFGVRRRTILQAGLTALGIGGAGVATWAIWPDGNENGAGSIPTTNPSATPWHGVLTGHTDNVTGVSFDENGRKLATSSWDASVRLWEVKSGKNIQTWQVAGGRPASALTFLHTGELLALAAGNDVEVWRADSGAVTATFTGHTDQVTSVCASPDGSTLASASEDGTVRTWAVGTAQPLRTFSGHTAAVRSVAFSPDGTRIVSGAWDGTVRMWDVANGTQLSLITINPTHVAAVAFNHNGTHVAVGTEDDSTVHIHDITTGGVVLTLDGAHLEQSGVQAIQYSPDGATIATGSADNTAVTWNSTTGVQQKTSSDTCGSEPCGHVVSVGFSPDSTTLAIGYATGLAQMQYLR